MWVCSGTNSDSNPRSSTIEPISSGWITSSVANQLIPKSISFLLVGRVQEAAARHATAAELVAEPVGGDVAKGDDAGPLAIAAAAAVDHLAEAKVGAGAPQVCPVAA